MIFFSAYPIFFKHGKKWRYFTTSYLKFRVANRYSAHRNVYRKIYLWSQINILSGSQNIWLPTKMFCRANVTFFSLPGAFNFAFFSLPGALNFAFFSLPGAFNFAFFSLPGAFNFASFSLPGAFNFASFLLPGAFNFASFSLPGAFNFAFFWKILSAQLYIVFRIRLGYVGLGYIRPGPVIGGADGNLG